MIKKFNTASAPSAAASSSAPQSGGSGMNKILIGALVVLAVYAGYQFVYKPMMEKRRKQGEDKE